MSPTDPHRDARPTRPRVPVRHRRAGLAVGLAAAALCSPAALAAIGCNVSSTGAGFGDYDPLATSADDSTASVSVTCTRVIFQDPFSVSYTLSLSRGSGSTTFAPRRLRSGPNRLNYNLFRDAARAQVWGDATGSTFVVSGTASFNWFQTTQTNTHTAYGRLPAQQDVVPGAYSDTIVVTITY